MAERVAPAVVEALRFQRAAVELPSLASPLYAALLDAALADVEAGGPCARVLAESPSGIDPIPDALPLRFLGGVHRLVLSGRAPALARWFPTAGGAFRPGVDDPSADFVATVEAHEDELVGALRQGVQTNEVGRCAALAVGFTALLRRYELPLRLLEVGASAGLNLRWDRWRYESGRTEWGDPAAPLRFAGDAYEAPRPDVSAPAALGPGAAVAGRRGCDRSPVDPTTEEGRLLLRSFVWPDQAERHARLAAALDAARAVPAAVDRADAGDWVAAQLADPAPGATTVVFHSIVWQYLPDGTRAAIAAAVASAGRHAAADAPVAWLRMEPSRDHPDLADLTLSCWPAPAEDVVLARTGYHGRPIRNVGGLPPLPGR